MDIVFRLLGALYSFYPVKLFIRKRVERYFFSYHITQILEDASKTYSIGEYWKITDLVNDSPFRGTLSELVRIGDFYPSPKDIAVAINVSTSAYCNKECVNEAGIIDLSFHLASEIKSRIISDQLLRTVFEDLNKDLVKLNVKGERAEIESLFSNKKDLFLSYYSTFSKPEYSYSIKIWHQSQDNSYIDWNEKDAITIFLNPMRIREGFFQIGFDYYCNQSQSRLSCATRHEGYELFDGDPTSNTVWMR